MNKDLSAIVADNMNALMRVRGEDTVTLGRKAGISQKTVWNVLRDERCNPTLRVLGSLGQALNAPPFLFLIDGSIGQTLPDDEVMSTVQRFLNLNSTGKKQVSEFVALWERAQIGE
ncbi:hypothetical protein [Marinobacter sp.]|uniref:hypothetical protein n=1 Tax=Marinobacter sp. TaxID=50741 RepID=UPI003A923DC2